MFERLIKLSFDLIDKPSTLNLHYSFILLRNNVLSIGWSSTKTTPMALKIGYRYQSCHSELSSIKRFILPPSELRRCKLVNIRINRLGQIQNSEPCKFCKKFLKEFDFREIWYTTKEGNFAKL